MDLSRKRKAILALLALVLLASGLYWANQPKEPAYQGKRLSEWVKQHYSYPGEDPSERDPVAAAAIRTMGTNCLPWLLKEYSAKPNRWSYKLDRWIPDHPLMNKVRTPFHERNSVAAGGLHILGPLAKDAIPSLEAILRDGDTEESLSFETALILTGIGSTDSLAALARASKIPNQRIRTSCAIALFQIGNPASDALKEYLSDYDEMVRSLAARGLARNGEPIHVWLPCLAALASSDESILRENSAHTIGKYGKGSKEAVLALQKLLTDTNDHVRVLAASGLGRMGEPSGVWLPSLTNILNNKHSYSRTGAIKAFGEFGEASQPVVPQLCELLNDPYENVRVAVTNVLLRIDPAAAAKAGVHPPPVIELPVER